MIQYLETHLSEIQLSIISITLVIILTFFSLKIFSYLFNNIKKLYTKRKLSIDYIALETLEKPTKVLITFFGFYFCIRLFFGIENIEKYNNLFSSIFYVSLIIIIYWYLQRITSLIEKRYSQRKNADKTLINAIAKVSRLSITIITLLVIFQTIGINIAGILAFGGVGGLAVGMAAKEMLSNFFGGLTIYLDQPFKVGDWINIPENKLEGTVEFIGWRQTTIRTFKKIPVYVPNALFTTLSVENPSRMTNRRIKEIIGIRYEDFEKTKKIVNEIASFLNSSQLIDKNQTIICNFNKYNTSSLDLFIYCFTVTTNWVEFLNAKEEILLEIGKIIELNNAEIAFPTKVININKQDPDI